MIIQGYEPIEDIGETTSNLMARVTRSAWEILSAYGFMHEEFVSENYRDTDDNDPTLEEFWAQKTELIKYGSDGNYFCLDQFPVLNGRIVRDIGFVALRLGEKDEDSMVWHQQIVFRLESHLDGAAIFTGTEDNFESVDSHDDILDVATFLETLKRYSWLHKLTDYDSELNKYPESSMMTRLNSYLQDEAEKNAGEEGE